MEDAENFFAMTFAKLSERGSSSNLGGCYQLFLAPRSKIANRRGIPLHRGKCSHHHHGFPPYNLAAPHRRSVNLLLYPSTRGRMPDSSQVLSRPSRNS